jgi:WD40 repeat protein
MLEQVAGTPEKRAKRLYQKFTGHTSWVKGIIHLPDGQRMITCSDASLRVWNLHSGKQIANEWRDDSGGGAWTIALSPDGKCIVSGGYNGAMRLWNANSGKVIAKWKGHKDHVTSVCWDRDGGRVVSGSYDGTAKVWDMVDGKTVLAFDTGHSVVEGIIYSPDTTMIATGGVTWGEKLFLSIFDAKTGHLITDLDGHTKRVTGLAWTAGGTTLISGSRDGSIRIWNSTTWQQIAILTEHSVRAIAISPDGHTLASTSCDKTARLWDLENGQPVGSPLQHVKEVNCVSFSADGKLLATGCKDNNAYLWDVSAIIQETGPIGELPLKADVS